MQSKIRTAPVCRLHQAAPRQSDKLVDFSPYGGERMVIFFTLLARFPNPESAERSLDSCHFGVEGELLRGCARPDCLTAERGRGVVWFADCPTNLIVGRHAHLLDRASGLLSSHTIHRCHLLSGYGASVYQGKPRCPGQRILESPVPFLFGRVVRCISAFSVPRSRGGAVSKLLFAGRYGVFV